MEKITCNIARDLIPSYLDDILTEDTYGLVKAHLADCAQCTQALEEETRRREEGLRTEKERGEAFSQKLLERRKFMTGLIVGFFIPFGLVLTRVLIGMIRNGILYGF